jgi:alanyl-tRNA synthetase
MVQFKQSFEGVQSPPFSRCVTHQKCVRAGGKHNDLDNVVGSLASASIITAFPRLL